MIKTLMISLWFFGAMSHGKHPNLPNWVFSAGPFETQAHCETYRANVLPEAPPCVERAVWVTYDSSKQR